MSYQVPMRRIGLAVMLALSLALAPLAAQGQQTGKLYRVGVLSSAAPPDPSPNVWGSVPS